MYAYGDQSDLRRSIGSASSQHPKSIPTASPEHPQIIPTSSQSKQRLCGQNSSTEHFHRSASWLSCMHPIISFLDFVWPTGMTSMNYTSCSGCVGAACNNSRMGCLCNDGRVLWQVCSTLVFDVGHHLLGDAERSFQSIMKTKI